MLKTILEVAAFVLVIAWFGWIWFATQVLPKFRIEAPSVVVPPPPPLIFAGTYAQATKFAERHNFRPDWVYITPDKTRGYTNPTVYLVGTYSDHPDYSDVMRSLEPAFPTFIGEFGEIWS